MQAVETRKRAIESVGALTINANKPGLLAGS